MRVIGSRTPLSETRRQSAPRIVICAIFAACVAGCGTKQDGGAPASKQAESKAASGKAGSPAPKPGARKFAVRTQPVGSRSLQYEIETVGNLVEENRFEIPARTAGAAEQVFFNEGDAVTTGQELCRIDYDRYKLLADQAKANADQQEAAVRTADAELADAIRETSTSAETARLVLQLAKSEFDRRAAEGSSSFTSSEERKQFESRYLQAQNTYRDALTAAQTRVAVAQAELNQARAQLDSARAAHAVAKDDLDRAVVRAPIAGYVQERRVTNGQFLTQGTVAAIMVQTDPIRLKFTVPESKAGSLTDNMRVAFTVPAFKDTKFDALVYDIAEMADSQTREVTCWARLENPDNRLRPGYFASVSIVAQSKSSAIVVPLASVLPTEYGMVCFVVQDGIAVRRKVATGLQVTGDAIEILGGLEVDEQLVVEGMESLQDGVPVQVLPTAEAPGPQAQVASSEDRETTHALGGAE